jgi:hypothetical protein
MKRRRRAIVAERTFPCWTRAAAATRTTVIKSKEAVKSTAKMRGNGGSEKNNFMIESQLIHILET